MKEFICINCPLGCHLTVDDSDLNNVIVTGNTCPRGAKYGKDEVTNPKRMVTSSCTVLNGVENVCSLKTSEAIPKGEIFECLKLIKGLKVEAPVKIGDVLVENVLNSGANLVATRNVGRK